MLHNDRIRELEAKLKVLREQEEVKKISEIRALEDGFVPVEELVRVCQEFGVESVSELGGIFRSRKVTIAEQLLDDGTMERVANYLRRHNGSTAAQISKEVGCDVSVPRKMAEQGLLISWGMARGKKYSLAK